ncbi:MAG: class I SAM-dependent methyltransferase [Deltaproteobacteria bacterium]|nr:class I SAM-dependent methyltransferase [Deltaproteobacteria bacterium]
MPKPTPHITPPKTPLACSLCDTPQPVFLGADQRRSYYQCPQCALVMVPPSQYLSLAAERRHYNCHCNSPDDPNYRQFLSTLFLPLNQLLPPASRGLDFGCGPGPTLHLMFEEAGHRMAVYDPYYFPDNSLLAQTWDFITLSEVSEHLHAPGEVLQRVWRQLNPGGMLGIMTRFFPANTPIETWFYKNDDTHVCFFSTTTFEYLAKRLNAQLQLEQNVAILKKNAAPNKRDIP